MVWVWVKGQNVVWVKQVIDQTAEIAYWFHVVARQIEKAELGGRLA